MILVSVLGFIAWFGPGEDFTFPDGDWIDLTHPFNRETVYWPTADGFALETVFAGTTEAGYHYEANQFRAAEHGGTHLDAPIHFAEGRHTADQVPLDRLIAPAIVINVTGPCAKDRDYRIGIADFLAWEKDHGAIRDGVIVLLNTGFGKYWNDREKYMGTGERGEAAVAKLHFPGLHPDAASWLAEKRNIAAIGLDTPSIDYGQSKLFRSHRILFEKNIPAFENVAHLDRLPPKGAWVFALPMKIEKGSGGPLRIVAFVPK